MTSILPNAKTQFFDAQGNPLAGGSVGFYIPATLVFKTTWQDASQATPNANPVILDAAGEAQIWGTGTYRQIVKDSLGNVVWDQVTQEPLAGFVAQTKNKIFAGPSTGVDATPTFRALVDADIPGTFSTPKAMSGAAFNEAHGADIASAATVDLTLATGNVVDITGTTSITAFTLPEGFERIVRFTDVLTITPGASLIVPGGLAFATAAGDFAWLRGYAAGVVRIEQYYRLAWPPGGGRVAQVQNSQTGAVATGTTAMPVDDTVPQQTEGDQYLTKAIQPTSATSLLIIEGVLVLASSTGSALLGIALFQDATAAALAAWRSDQGGAGTARVIPFRHVMVAGTVASTTFKIRAGDNAGGTTTLNGVAGGRIFGGVMASTLTITEVLQ